MTSRAFDVHLHGRKVGRIIERDGYRRFDQLESYLEAPERPVLGQWFEDHLGQPHQGRGRRLPPFFANLVPEGELRRLIERSVGVVPDDDLLLLAAIGRDLPGAVEVRAGSDDHEHAEWEPVPEATSADHTGMRFSLGGAQLKFSVLLAAEKLILPAADDRGRWIAKVEPARFVGVAANEYSTLEWARASGFEVPKCRLMRVSDFEGAVPGLPDRDRPVVAVERYDRTDEGRVHQEDLLQVLGLHPTDDHKFGFLTYEKLAALVDAIAGPGGYEEVIRRLVFMLASGNCDAHLKNWSLCYPDRIEAVLTPLYDQVATIAFGELEQTLALKLAGTKEPTHIDRDAFERLAARCGKDPDTTLAVVDETLDRLRKAWRDLAAELPWPTAHRDALLAWWKRIPLLRSRSLD